MKSYITLSVLLISLVAVGAYAQAEGDPAKEQIQNKENLQIQEQLQNQDETQNQEQVISQEQVQEQNQLQTRKNNDGLDGDKSLDGDKPQTGDPVKDQTRQDGSDVAQNPGNGTASQKYPDYEGVGGPHGTSGSEGDKVLDGECDGDQTQQRNYGTGDGDNHELGDTHRRGDENTGEGGPHGPLDGGTLDGLLLKILGDNADGTFAGDMLQHRWGPGSNDGESPFGPNEDHVGYGQRSKHGGDVDDPTKSVRGQARAGRR